MVLEDEPIPEYRQNFGFLGEGDCDRTIQGQLKYLLCCFCEKTGDKGRAIGQDSLIERP
jgi:hypothetical protein